MNRKTRKSIIIIIMIILLANMIILPNKVNAIKSNEEIQITVKKQIEAPYAYMEVERGQMNILVSGENIVYAMSEEKDIPNTILNSNAKSTNEQLNQVLKNGYPIKTPEEMYCKSEEEAYLATQEAIFTVLYNKDTNHYTHKGESGWRIRGAIARIMRDTNSDIQSLEDTNEYNTIDVTEQNKDWIVDTDNENYVSKQYNITVLPDIIKSSITLEGGQDVKILGEDNLEKSTFTNSDKLKVAIPENTSQNFSIKLSATLQSYEPYISKNTQNPDITYIIMEKTYTKVEETINVKKGELSTIKIINLDNETKGALEGNTFEFLNENYSVLQNDIITDENGEHIIPNVEKGKYYIRQTSVIDGYSKNGILIEVNVTGLEELVKININNCKTNIIEETTYNKEINVTEDNQKTVQNNNIDVSNIHTSNIIKETNNLINETNQKNINYFNNIRTHKNEINYKKISNYTDTYEGKNVTNIMLEGEQSYWGMSRNDVNNYLDILSINSTNVPTLPVASR